MAKSVKTVTSKISDIQSKAQEAIQTGQKQVASSTQATQSWSTTTPTVTDTPKVTSTAKAMPSITRPDISSIVATQPTTQPTTTVNAKDLLWSKTQVTPLKKAATPDLLSTKTEDKEIRKTALPLNLVKAADKQWWAAKEAVDKTLLEQFTDWFNETPEKVTQKVWDLFKEPVMSFWTSFERMISDTEYWVAWLADTIERAVWGKWWFTKAFQEQQWWYWDAYGKETDLKAAKLYEEDTQAQNVSRSVSDYLWTITWNKEISNMVWEVVWNVTASLKDPEQIASVAWYMTPALIMQAATWGWFLMNTAIWLPSQSTQVYKDFAEDPELSSQFTDNQLFTISTWLGTLLSMVETFWDALWDMPWAKAMSRSLRNAFTRTIKTEATKWLTKEITNVVDKNLIKDIKQPILNALKKWYLWSIWEWLEEVAQDTMQTETARALGSKREWMSVKQLLTTFFTAQWMWLFISWPWAWFNIKQNQDLKEEYDQFSKTVDKVAPWINEETKQAFFSAMITSQQNDANLSEKKIEEYEEQTTELYNQLSALEEEAKTTQDTERISQIDKEMWDVNNKIKEIDKKINQWKNTEEAINKYLEENKVQETKEEELPAVKQEIQMPSEVWGENLSEQTMSEIVQNEEKAPIKLPSTDYEYTSLASALNQKSNTYLQSLSDDDLKLLHDTAFNKWQSLMDNEEYWSPLIKATTSIVGKVNEEIARRERESAIKTEKKTEQKVKEEKSIAWKLKFKNAKDYVNKMIAIDKKNWIWDRLSKREQDRRKKKYMNDFLRTNLEWDLAAHLPWLKNVNLKQIEWNLTEQNLKDIAEMLSLVSTTLWIDFNKVIKDKNLSMNIVNNTSKFLYNTGNLWLMAWKPLREMVKDLKDRTWIDIDVLDFWAEIAKMWVAITLQYWPKVAGATMAHELMHLIDFAISTEENLPLYLEWWKVTYTSIIKDDNSWRTYKVWNYDTAYYNRWQEILARYAEQYFAYKNDKDLFDDFARPNRMWYWTEEEFLKLLPKFESFIKDRLWAKLLDEENKFYYDIVSKINQNEFQKKTLEFNAEWLNEITVRKMLDDIEEEYAWILQTVEWMKWDLKEEIEAYVQLSTLQADYEMAKAKWEEYLKLLETTPQQQEVMDNITETVVPDPPQNAWTILYWLPYFWWSNIEEWIGDIIEWWKWEKLWESYMKEEDIIKIRNKWKKFQQFFKELWDAWKDVFTPAFARIYKISPRIAWRLHTMEAQTEINKHRYRMKAKWFVESLSKLKGNNALEVKMALLDYWALASEQWENIEQYKKEETAKLKEVLLRNGFKEQDINDMFEVLNDIWRQYKEAWLDITLTDMYFPRVVKDYEWLIDYMNRVSGKDIKVNKTSLLIKIKRIKSDPKLTDEEKERKIRNAITIEFKQPWTTSQHGKERKMWKLSDWWEWIFAYYENPIEAIDHYIVSMTTAIQRQLFLGWMKEDANLEWDIVNQTTEESISNIIWKLVENWQVSESGVDELQKAILAVINKKKSPKAVTTIKDITYISTITNFLSAINQLDDLWVVILKDRSWLKHIVKTIFGKAWIKYDDLWLDDAYEMFREEWGVTNWLFKKSFFNMFDRLGKTSFVNTAWQSMIRQSKNEKTKKFLYTRLQAMYWTESADRMMEKIEKENYNDEDGQIDIEILRDLLYQLWSTQPIYTSSMPVTYLNHPWSRLSYALSSFTLKRINMLLQWAKEVYKNSWWWAIWVRNAWAWIMWTSVFLAMFWAAIWDVWDYLKWKKDETFLWNLINKWIDDALAAGWSDMLDSWLKIWDLSEYDLKIFKQQWMKWLLAAKISPFIFDLGKDVVEAVWEHDKDEITDLAKYVPIFWKLTYYWFWDELWKSTKKSKEKKDEWDFWEDDWSFEEDDWDWWEEDEWDWSEEEWDWDEEDWGF